MKVKALLEKNADGNEAHREFGSTEILLSTPLQPNALVKWTMHDERQVLMYIAHSVTCDGHVVMDTWAPICNGYMAYLIMCHNIHTNKFHPSTI